MLTGGRDAGLDRLKSPVPWKARILTDDHGGCTETGAFSSK